MVSEQLLVDRILYVQLSHARSAIGDELWVHPSLTDYKKVLAKYQGRGQCRDRKDGEKLGLRPSTLGLRREVFNPNLAYSCLIQFTRLDSFGICASLYFTSSL
jgi:hypothetical protein